jgi:hypothetical protein
MGNKQGYQKEWRRLEPVLSNPERRTRYLPPLPGAQSNWRRVGVAARYYPKQRQLKSGFRFVLEEQLYNDGYRYRLRNNDFKSPDENRAPIPLGWHQMKARNDQVLMARHVPQSTNPPSPPSFYQIKLDMKAEFSASYRPENLFGDSQMSASVYRKSTMDIPMRKQV